MESVKEGTVNYTSSSLQCTFTTHQAVLPPTGETEDEAATALVMAPEIDAVKQSVGKPVEVVTDRRLNLRQAAGRQERDRAAGSRAPFQERQGRRSYLPDGPARHTRQRRADGTGPGLPRQPVHRVDPLVGPD
jgi:hypothetical protein